MGHPNGMNWKAWQEEASSGNGAVTLVLTGLVQVDEDSTPGIELYQPATLAPKTLALRLTSKGGVTWKRIWFEKQIQAGQYTFVQLYWGTNVATGGKVKIQT